MLTEKSADHGVGRMVEFQDQGQQIGTGLQ
jgi:hypothetical protein